MIVLRRSQARSTPGGGSSVRAASAVDSDATIFIACTSAADSGAARSRDRPVAACEDEARSDGGAEGDNGSQGRQCVSPGLQRAVAVVQRQCSSGCERAVAERGHDDHDGEEG